MAIKINSLFIIFLGLLLILCSYSAAASSICTENWSCTAWGSCNQGISERRCFDLNGCRTVSEMPAESAACSEVLKYCYDSIINQDESAIDCGGKICDKCGIGKSCYRNDDCSEGSCISGKCAFASETTVQNPAVPLDYFSTVLQITLGILTILVLLVLIHLLKTKNVFRPSGNSLISSVMKKLRKSAWRFQRCTNFQGLSEPDVSERLKKQKILVLPDKKERVKEEIKIISKKDMSSSKKKTRFSRFADNINGYIKSMKSGSGPTIKEKPQKGLLNKNPSKIQAHPAKEFMLSNLKEVYNE